MNFIGIDPIRALFWTAVLNGVVAVPMIVVIMLMASRQRVMRQSSFRILAVGGLERRLMTTSVITMFRALASRLDEPSSRVIVHSRTQMRRTNIAYVLLSCVPSGQTKLLSS